MQLLQPVFTLGLLVLARFGFSWGEGEDDGWREGGVSGAPLGVRMGRPWEIGDIALADVLGGTRIPGSSPMGGLMHRLAAKADGWQGASARYKQCRPSCYR